jgi:hypothetical protein
MRADDEAAFVKEAHLDIGRRPGTYHQGHKAKNEFTHYSNLLP